MQNTMYLIRRTTKNFAEIAKFSDGRIRPDVVYRLNHDKCNCLGSTRNQCKHEKMYQEWHNNGEPVVAIYPDENVIINLEIV